MIESIEKLRASQYVGQHMSLSEIADEIEREIAEKYMVRPCDMDGVRYSHVRAFKGSSEMDRAEFGKLLDGVVQECRQQSTHGTRGRE